MRKPVIGVFDQAPHKPGCTATQDDKRLEISYIGNGDSRGTKVGDSRTLAPERYTAGFCMVTKVIPWRI